MTSITVEERKIPFGDTEVELEGKKYILHTFQKVFYSDLSNLPTVIVVIAPTGAGKTFAFTLPIIYAKNHNYFPPRGLVIAPTNALVEDMYNSFKKIAKVEKITGSTLKKHGIERPKELLNRVKSANIVVTNPDIVNFVTHGGYHIEESGKRRHILNFQDWTEFFGKIDYIIFDEYHLYDEEQIANILIWLLTSYHFFKNIKWFFVSATPERVLLKILDKQEIDYIVVQQELADSGRVVQGKQKIHFIEASQYHSLYRWMFNDEEIRSDVKNKISEAIKDKKVFFLFNSLREAKIVENKMRNLFRDAKIGVNTGFETRQKDFDFNPENYDIIITTSKAEVGVDYPTLQLAYIDSGKYLRNFLQRIGRIGRGEEESEIYCVIPVAVVERIKRHISENGTSMNYYEFVNVLNQSFEDIKLKEERIPVFMGALLWSTYNALKSHERRRILDELIEEFPYSKVLFKLDKLVEEVKEEMDEEFYENLKIFWNVFKRSFIRFRDDTIQWKIFYKNQETEYDIIWVLNNAYIEEIDRDKKTIVINDFRPKKEKIVKGIVTRSLLENPYADNNFQQIGGIRNEQIKEWGTFLYSGYISKLYTTKLKRWLSEVEVPKKLEDLLKKLSPLYSKRRIEILDVLYDSGEIKDVYIL
ncbi:type I-D CRISPR-associated helicase Cas3' [Archaeoglobales archaeon]|nr:MAG: type I-D CRISPR-associated helicase Cas3' [Archaeoglobales archaeon]